MGEGRLSSEQCAVVRRFTEGQRVHDLGAGDLSLARKILNEFKAESVVAVDKDSRAADANVKVVRAAFNTYRALLQAPIQVAFVSWPLNCQLPGLLDLLAPAGAVIYLGKNTDGVACGWPGFYLDLSAREVLAHVPERRNTLIVYGPQRVNRLPLGEELAGIDFQKCYSYYTAEGIAAHNRIEQELRRAHV